MAVAQIQIRRGTTAEWAAADPVVLAAGEQGYDTTLKRFKMGDGATAFSALEWNTLLPYPVGSIYMSVVSTSPATLFGGTWSAWGAGRVPVGLDAGQTEFDTVEETGGAKTHTHGLTDGHAKITVVDYLADGYVNWAEKAVSSWTVEVESKITSGLKNGITAPLTAATELGGSTDSGSTLPPYIVCYMWKRTA